MKQRILKLTPEELMRVLQGKTAHLALPMDAELINIKYDAFSKQVVAVIRSDVFGEDIEGAPILELPRKAPPQTLTSMSTSTVDATQKSPVGPQSASLLQRPLIQPLNASNQQVPPVNSMGVGVKTLGPKPEVGVDTCGFEGEFTKEQRRVLKFISEGDYVIVKPTQFLKTEWEDINDTVKSIGGKWVKGATIDYWVIPKNQTPEE